MGKSRKLSKYPNEGVFEAPIDGEQYARKNGAWNIVTGGVPIVTTTPTLSGNASGTEATVLNVTITNYSATATYTISVEAGSYIRTGDNIAWTLPAFTGVDDIHDMSVQATEPGETISLAATHTATVLEASSLPDQTILFENTTIDGVTYFPVSTNVDFTSNTILATLDSASATSYKVEQDVLDTDFTEATPTADNTAINYTISAGATTTSVTITGATTFVIGDILLMNKTETTTLTAVDTTLISTDNGGGSFTFDLTALSFTNAPLIVAKNVSAIETSLVATAAADSFVARTPQTYTADDIGGVVANDEFEVTLGTASPVNITTSDFIWSKDRVSATSHRLSNSITGDFYLQSDTTAAEIATVPALGANDVSWRAELPTDNASNTDGTITSVTKSNSFMSAISYSGTGVAGTIGHSLGVAPDLVIYKNRSSAVFDWIVTGDVLSTANDYMTLNSTIAISAFTNVNVNTTTTINAVVTDSINNNTDTYIAYAFTSVAGKCKVGTVTISAGVMSGDTDLGFPLGFGIFKPSSIVGDWEIIDSETTNFLEANTTNTEATNGTDRVTVTGNIISNNGLPDGTYIYMAIAKEDVATPAKITTVFDTDTRSGRDFKVKTDLADSGDEVSRISIPIKKLA